MQQGAIGWNQTAAEDSIHALPVEPPRHPNSASVNGIIDVTLKVACLLVGNGAK